MTFSHRHPAIVLICLAAILAGTLVLRHPAYLAVSFWGAFAWSLELKGGRSLRFNLCMVPLALVFALWYASFSHFGVTNLFRNRIGNYITLESLVYGLVLGGTIAALLLWMSCVHAVFTSDKIIFLIGRLSPRLAIFCAILLRLVPRIKGQAIKMDTGRRGLGLGTGQGGAAARSRTMLALASGLITWSLENLIGVSDSISARGGRLTGRTAYALYRFDHRDRGYAVLLTALITLSVMGWLLGQARSIYAPTIRFCPLTPLWLLFWSGWASLCLLPLATDLADLVQFHRRTK